MTVPEIMPQVRELYTRNAVGCCLHIVLDDGNVKDKDVEFCLKQAAEKKHPYCYLLGLKLLSMTTTQRNQIRKESYD